MTILQILEGPNAKMNLTMLFSSSSYPKIIYGMPLFSQVGQIRFEFEFKFKFELNQKRKWKNKKKRKGSGHTGWPRASRPNFILYGLGGQSPHGQACANKRKKKWACPLDMAHGLPSLLGPGRHKVP